MEPSRKLYFRNFICASLCLLLLTSTCFAIALDGTFASGGKFTTTFADTGNPSTGASRVFVQPSGRVVVVGRHTQQGGDGRVSGIAMAGLTSAGVLDSTFGTGGKVVIWNSSSSTMLTDAAMQSDGSILLFYQFLQTPNTNLPVLVKYTANGQLDSTFTPDPRVSAFPSTHTIRLTLGVSGKIYLLLLHNSSHFVMRLSPDGTRDGTFGTSGLRSIDVSRIPALQRGFTGFHELPDGKIVLTGLFAEGPGFPRSGFAIRYDSDTNVDRSFGRQGVMTVSLPDGSVEFVCSVVQPDGKLLLGGYFTFLGSNALLVRLTTRGRFDGSFGTRGIVKTSFNNINGIRGIAVAPDGRILVTGTSGAKAVPSNQRLFVAKFSASGVREDFLLTNFVANLEAGRSDVALQPDGKIVAAGFSQSATGFLTELGVARLTP